jgi:hypothetical protein
MGKNRRSINDHLSKLDGLEAVVERRILGQSQERLAKHDLWDLDDHAGIPPARGGPVTPPTAQDSSRGGECVELTTARIPGDGANGDRHHYCRPR